jgi:hypothetical protein
MRKILQEVLKILKGQAGQNLEKLLISFSRLLTRLLINMF